MTIEPKSIQLNDGRCVRYRDMGDPSGIPVVMLHGTPGSSARFLSAHDVALRLRLRLIAPDRWGYAGTTPPRSPALRLYAADVAELVDRLDIGKFALMGVSGGGPFATVSAVQLADRVTRLGLVSPVGPIIATADDGIETFHKLAFLLVPRFPGALQFIYGAFRLIMQIAPERGVLFAAARAPAFDHAVLADPEERKALARAFSEGLALGTAGAVLDMKLFSENWNAAWPAQLAPSQRPPSRLWIGERDGNVPVPAAMELAQQLGAQTIIVPEAGHLWLSTAWQEVLTWLTQGDGLAATDRSSALRGR